MELTKQLPYEIWSNVFKYVKEPRTLLTFSKVSSLHNNLIREKINKLGYSTLREYTSVYTETCFFCGKSKAKIYYKNQNYATCTSCIYSLEIYLSDVKKEFLLTNAELAPLEIRKVRSSYKRNAVCTKFLRDDVEQLALKLEEKLSLRRAKRDSRNEKSVDKSLQVSERKIEIDHYFQSNFPEYSGFVSGIYNDELYIKYIKTGIPKQKKKKVEFLDKMKILIEQYILKVKQERLRKLQEELDKSARKVTLINLLTEKDLNLRSDSKLCQRYINHGDEDVNYVVDRMCDMKYLFDYCDIRGRMEIIYNKRRNECDYLGFDYEYDYEYTIFEEAERWCWKNFKKPETWPWLA